MIVWLWLSTCITKVNAYWYYWFTQVQQSKKIERLHDFMNTSFRSSTNPYLLILWIYIINSYSKWIRQKIYQFFINRKLKKILYFVTYILTNNVPHEITQIFWKNSQFENMMAGFLLRCQNSLRWEICLICHWNIDSWKQKLSLGCVMVPKSNQKSSRYSTNYI